MNIIVVDDEMLALQSMENAIEEVIPEAKVKMFTTSASAMSELVMNDFCPDVAFIDIAMPDIDGIQLSKQIKDIYPKTNIIYVTAYTEYALTAIQERPSGYILKPATPEKIQTEIENLRYPPAVQELSRLEIKCFGNFEVYSNQRPVSFTYQKTKELFAYLVDRKGAACNTAILCSVLWEDKPDDQNQRAYLRKLIADLSHSLKAVGAGDAFIKQRNSFAVATDKVDCDYYKMLKGDASAANQYTGEYMNQYDWAEMSVPVFPHK